MAVVTSEFCVESSCASIDVVFELCLIGQKGQFWLSKKSVLPAQIRFAQLGELQFYVGLSRSPFGPSKTLLLIRLLH